MSVGFAHGLAVTEDDKVYSWVLQARAVLDDPLAKHSPLEVSGIPPGIVITDIKSGNFATILLTKDRNVWKIEHPVPLGGLPEDMP